MSAELEQLIVDRIRREGPMPFAAFMSLALYHPRFGYYSRGGPRTGWSGHFVTSPELDPVFAELWTRAFEQVWGACGRPAAFQVVEVGPGEGSFAHTVLAASKGAFADALSYVLVERLPAARERQEVRLAGDRRVRWVRSPDEIDPGTGIVFANEVLDNLPVHLVEMREGRLLEVLVETADDRLVLTRRTPAGPELHDFITRCGIELRDGHTLEIPMATESFVARATTAVDRGAVIFVDYGIDARRAAERPGGTLLCYSRAGVDTDPLSDVGDKDITVHANWTVVGQALRRGGCRVVGPLMQRRVLTTLGLGERDRELRAQHDAAVAAKRGAAALEALSRRQALGALADPGGLGGLEVVAGFKDVEVPAFMTQPT